MSPPTRSEPTSPASLTDAIRAAQQHLSAAKVCLVAGASLSPIEQAEFSGFTQVLPHLTTVTTVEFHDVHDLYLSPAVEKLTSADVVVKFAHGPFNRAGLLQAALDSLQVRRAGHASGTDLLSQHKSLVKRLMLRSGVPTLEYVVAHGGTDITGQIEHLRVRSDTDAFVVKPDDGNASEGLQWVPTAADAIKAVGDGRGRLLVEPYLPGRIITVGTVSLASQTFTLAPLEYLLDGRPIMDSAWKQHPHRARAILEPATETQVRAHAAAVHTAVGANGLSRTDFIIGANGSVVALEINTNVGLGRPHDLAQAFAATDLSYEALVICQVASGLAFTRQR